MDGELTSYDEVVVTVLAAAPTNRPPSVEAGSNATVTVGDVLQLNGFIEDDALPDTHLLVQWTTVSGPTNVTLTGYYMYILQGGIGCPSTNKAYQTSSSTAKFKKTGTYVLRLTGSDGAFSPYDDVTVTVMPKPASLPPQTGSSHGVSVPTEPGTSYTILYSDGPLANDMTWFPFANTNNGIGSWRETNTALSTFTFTDDEGPSTTGGPTPTGIRYYRVTGNPK